MVEEKAVVGRSKPTGHEYDDQELVEQAWDDVSGEELDGKKVKRARLTEI